MQRPYCLAVSCVRPPIPVRAFDWAACVDGREEGITGRGATREAAVADLLEQVEELSKEKDNGMVKR